MLPVNKMGAKKRKGGRKVIDPIALERGRVEAAEARSRQLAMLQARLQELIMEERRMFATAADAIEARWMVFLRECKQKELVAMIEVVRRDFDSILDRKNAVVSMLMEDIDEAEEQYKQVFRSHMEVVDSLIELNNRHMDELQGELEHDLLEMKGDFALEKEDLRRNHTMEVADLKLILDNMAHEAELLEKKLQVETSEAHETAAERLDEERKRMEADMLRASEAIRSELDARYKEFMSAAQVNMKDYMDKSKEDQETTERIASQLRKIDKLQESVTSWRTNLARNAREWEQRNRAIQAERDATFTHLKNLKKMMQTWRQSQARDLANLVKDSKAAESKLEAVSTKAERILRLVQLCKPLETEREQVLGFEAHVSPAEIQEEVNRRVAATEPGAAEPEKGVLRGPTGGDDWQLLERFWLKHNKVMLDCAAIAQERVHLERENQQLQSLLKQYLDDVSVNDAAVRSGDTLILTKAAPNVVQAAAGMSSKGQAMYNSVVDGNKFVTDVSRQRVHR